MLFAPQTAMLTEFENTYVDHELQEQKKRYFLPNIGLYHSSCRLSVIIPALNEQDRIEKALLNIVDYLNSKMTADDWEILVIDDGSTDETRRKVLEFATQLPPSSSRNIRLVEFKTNKGKGSAVRQGMLNFCGDYAIFCDADGATPFEEVEKLLDLMNKIEQDGFGVVIGSRAHLVTSDAVVKRSKLRNMLMHLFHIYLRTIVGIGDIKDTQCGFKLFTRRAALYIFSNMHLDGWAFDIEVIRLAHTFKIPIQEVAVNWREITGSKLHPVRDSINMAYDLFVMRINYLLGMSPSAVSNTLTNLIR